MSAQGRVGVTSPPGSARARAVVALAKIEVVGVAGVVQGRGHLLVRQRPGTVLVVEVVAAVGEIDLD